MSKLLTFLVLEFAHLKNGMIIVVTTLKVAVRVKGTNIDVGMHIQLSKMAGLF